MPFWDVRYNHRNVYHLFSEMAVVMQNGWPKLYPIRRLLASGHLDYYTISKLDQRVLFGRYRYLVLGLDGIEQIYRLV
jgi:hypothetical protein